MDSPTTGLAAVELSGVVKTFQSPGGEPVRAVDGINLAIAPGEVVAFLGPNGAGKTTSLDMVLGLTTPSAGTVAVFGGNPRQAVSGGPSLGSTADGRPASRHHRTRDRADDRLHLPSARRSGGGHRPDRTARVARRKVSKCSGGEQQRLRFALALLPDPDLLVLDEPTAGMDVNGTPRVLGHHARRRRRGTHRRLRHALPGGGRRLRRADRDDRRRARRRRRTHREDPISSTRSHRLR